MICGVDCSSNRFSKGASKKGNLASMEDEIWQCSHQSIVQRSFQQQEYFLVGYYNYLFYKYSFLRCFR
jgi:hypothetical protein